MRLAALPPKEMFTSGTSAGTEEVALRLRAFAVLSRSAMVKARGPTGMPPGKD